MQEIKLWYHSQALAVFQSVLLSQSFYEAPALKTDSTDSLDFTLQLDIIIKPILLNIPAGPDSFYISTGKIIMQSGSIPKRYPSPHPEDRFYSFLISQLSVLYSDQSGSQVAVISDIFMNTEIYIDQAKQITLDSDIDHITVQQAFAGWCTASLEQPS